MRQQVHLAYFATSCPASLTSAAPALETCGVSFQGTDKVLWGGVISVGTLGMLWASAEGGSVLVDGSTRHRDPFESVSVPQGEDIPSGLGAVFMRPSERLDRTRKSAIIREKKEISRCEPDADCVLNAEGNVKCYLLPNGEVPSTCFPASRRLLTEHVPTLHHCRSPRDTELL